MVAMSRINIIIANVATETKNFILLLPVDKTKYVITYLQANHTTKKVSEGAPTRYIDPANCNTRKVTPKQHYF